MKMPETAAHASTMRVFAYASHNQRISSNTFAKHVINERGDKGCASKPGDSLAKVRLPKFANVDVVG